MHSTVFEGGGAHGTPLTEKIFQMKGQPSTSEHQFPPAQSLQSPGQQLNSFIHSFHSWLVGTYPVAGPMLGPGYTGSALPSGGLPLVGSPVSEEQLTWRLFSSASLLPLPLWSSQSGCSACGAARTPVSSPVSILLLSLQVIKSQKPHFCTMKTETKWGTQMVSHSDTCLGAH